MMQHTSLKIQRSVSKYIADPWKRSFANNNNDKKNKLIYVSWGLQVGRWVHKVQWSPVLCTASLFWIRVPFRLIDTETLSLFNNQTPVCRARAPASCRLWRGSKFSRAAAPWLCPADGQMALQCHTAAFHCQCQTVVTVQSAEAPFVSSRRNLRGKQTRVMTVNSHFIPIIIHLIRPTPIYIMKMERSCRVLLQLLLISHRKTTGLLILWKCLLSSLGDNIWSVTGFLRGES